MPNVLLVLDECFPDFHKPHKAYEGWLKQVVPILTQLDRGKIYQNIACMPGPAFGFMDQFWNRAAFQDGGCQQP